MVDPTTANTLLSIPAHLTDNNTWDTPVNGNFTSLDGHFGGVTTIALSSATTITLSKPTGTTVPAVGTTQAENFALVLNGNISGKVTITLPMPGRYLVQNNCTSDAMRQVVLVAPVSGTTTVGVPPGRTSIVWTDGVSNATLCSEPAVGSILDVAGLISPSWITNSTPAPYVSCNGATYSTSLYPALGNALGSTFGGDGSTTFAVPTITSRLGASKGLVLIRTA